MKVNFEFEDGSLIGFEAVSDLQTRLVVEEGSANAGITLTRWDLFMLETFLVTLRNKQENEPAIPRRVRERGEEVREAQIRDNGEFHKQEEEDEQGEQGDEQDAPQPGATPQPPDTQTLQSLVGQTQKAIAVPFQIDPSNPPDTVVFLNKQGREVGRIVNVGSQTPIDVRAQA